MFKFNKTYFLFFIALFLVEASIAYFLKDGFIRHTFGDFLVVIMLYCFLKSFLNIQPFIIAIFVLCVSFCIEYLQYFNVLEGLGLENNSVAKLVLGNTFHLGDLLAYLFGVLFVLGIETKFTDRSH